MAHFDVFNGDADGVCALIQLHLACPKPSSLVTGVKRDINLLSQIEAQAGDTVTALDISMEKNSDALSELLGKGVTVFYADHHAHGDIPDSPLLEAHIDTRSDTCTSLIINQLLDNKFAHWAVAAAFGDNMNVPAEKLAKQAGLDAASTASLKELGTLINYNGYGSNTDDLHFHPATLFQELVKFEDPLTFLSSESEVFERLQSGYASDLQQARSIEAHYETPAVAVFCLPNEAWSRRVSGAFGNIVAVENPDRAHAIVTTGSGGQRVVSLRAPINNPHHAETVAKQFPTGGGRKRAAGINALPPGELTRLIEVMEHTYG